MKIRLNYYLQFSTLVILIFLTHNNEEHFQTEILANTLYIFCFATFMSFITDFIHQKFLFHKSYIINSLKLILFISSFVTVLLITIKYLEFIISDDLQIKYSDFLNFADETGAWILFYQDQIVNNSFSFLGYSYFYLLDRGKHLIKDLNKNKIELSSIELLDKESSLNLLQHQVNPHFLFNSLNSIAGLIHDDPKKAINMSSYLKNFFQYVNHSGEIFCSINEELKLIKSYLNIEKIRFDERLNIEYDIDESLLKTQMPRLLIQPIIENAIKHGISPYQKPGFIKLKVSKKNGEISIQVRDSGEYFDFSKKGYGLKNIKNRMKHFYGEEQRVFINSNKGGTEIIVLIPLGT